MQNLHIDYQGTELGFAEASRLAVAAARENRILEPTIVSWHERGSDRMSPRYDGADPDTWWAKYGEGNGGRLGVSVGGRFDFVLTDSRGYQSVDPLPVRNLTDEEGNEYICITRLLGEGCAPIDKACVPIDEWAANQY
jgi:hypothetical protein